jgi:hypothetical protein
MGYGAWKNYSEGDDTINDDFIMQGPDLFFNLLNDLIYFVESDKSAAAWLRATNRAEQFVKDYAEIPQGAFSAYQYWGRNWVFRQVAVNLYNTIVSDIKKYIDGAKPKADMLAHLRYCRWLSTSAFLLAPYIEDWMNSSANTIGTIFSNRGALQNPKITGSEYEEWLNYKYVYDGQVHFASADIRDLMESFRAMFDSNIIPMQWPVVKMDVPVNVVRDDITDEIVIDDVDQDAVVIGTGPILPDAVVVSFDGKIDYVATAKKYAVPLGLGVLAIFALS